MRALFPPKPYYVRNAWPPVEKGVMQEAVKKTQLGCSLLLVFSGLYGFWILTALPARPGDHYLPFEDLSFTIMSIVGLSPAYGPQFKAVLISINLMVMTLFLLSCIYQFSRIMLFIGKPLEESFSLIKKEMESKRASGGLSK